MRLFVALLPPPSVLDELARAAEPLYALPDADRLTWTERQGWHITLAFYGEVAEEQRAEVDVRLARAARRHTVPALRLSGGGRFTERVLWTGVTGERMALARLAGSAAAVGRRVGAEHARDREGPFRPHLTLARNRNRVDLTPFVDALAPFESRSWEAAELALVRSHLPTEGVPGAQPRYTTEAAWPLGG